MAVRRVRGTILRLVRRRRVAVLAGAALIGPALWLETSGADAAWWIDGLSMLLGATGAALLWTGLTGFRPDWVEGSERWKEEGRCKNAEVRSKN